NQNINVYKGHHIIIPINKQYLRVGGGAITLIMITIIAITIDKRETDKSILPDVASFPKGIPNIPFKKIPTNWTPNKNMNTPMTAGLNNVAIFGPRPVLPINT